MIRGLVLAAALALTACGGNAKKCTTNADCTGGQVCSVQSGTCTTGTGGGIGGGLGGGTGTGGGTATGGGSTGGGSATGGGTGTGGGSNTTNGGATCEAAVTITPGTLTGDTTGAVNDYDPGCTGDVTPGSDAVYKITVPAGQVLRATAVPETATTGNQFDVALYLVESPASNCIVAAGDAGTFTCLDAADDPQDVLATETVTYLNSGTAPKDIFIVVDSYFDMMINNPDGGVGLSNEGRFTLTTTVAAPAAGEICSTATALTAGTALMNQSVTAAIDDYDGNGTGCFGSSSGDLAYRIDVPAGQLLTLTVTPDSAFDVAVSLSDAAAACNVTCIGGKDTGADGDPEVVTWANRGTGAATLYVVVDGYQGSTGTFSIVGTLSTPPADDLCDGATALTAGSTVNGTTTGYSDDYQNGAMFTGCASGTVDADRAYTLSVPAGQRATVTLTPDGGYSPSLNLIEGAAAACGAQPRICAAGIGTGTTPRVVNVFNTSGSAKSYFAVIDSSSGAGDYTLGFTSAVPPTDDTCTTATTAAPTNGTGNLTGFQRDYGSGTGCRTANGPDRVYTVTLNADQKLSYVVAPTSDAGGFDPVINLIAGPASNCETTPRTCVQGVDSTLANGTERGAYTNSTGATQNLFVVVSDYSASSTNRDFAMQTTVAAAPAGETCRTPVALTLPATRTADTLDSTASVDVTYASAASTTCYVPLTLRGEVVYSATVAANKTLTVTATSTNAHNVYVNVLDGAMVANCTSAAACLAKANTTTTDTAQTETATYVNATTSAKPVFIVVSTASSFTTSFTDGGVRGPMTFNLSATEQ